MTQFMISGATAGAQVANATADVHNTHAKARHASGPSGSLIDAQTLDAAIRQIT